jgi:hypothetical protein
MNEWEKENEAFLIKIGQTPSKPATPKLAPKKDEE